MSHPFAPETYFDLEGFEHASLFEGLERVWDALKRIKEYLAANLKPGIHGLVHPSAVIEGDVYIGPGAVVEPHCYIKGPTLIGAHCEIRQGAYLRGDILLGEHAVVGHTTEVKGSVFLPHAKAPHFAYVGDSILGRDANLGAGTKISNFKITRDEVKVPLDGAFVGTGLRKFGAVIGDKVQIGCNAVLNPGTLVGREAMIYALASVRGIVAPKTVVKVRQGATTDAKR